MKPLITVRRRPGDIILTLDSRGEIAGREAVQGRFIRRETACCALALVFAIAIVAITFLFF
ncbi:MAG: hypothetical protein IPL51_09920 [Candidatus Competibacteraceae bacterium]|nr:hypothetical protein [Candidatus Competibacteraceae bacterium]